MRPIAGRPASTDETATFTNVKPLAALLRSDKGIIKACEHNAKLLIEGAPQYAGLHFDEFRARLRIGDRDWIDADDLGVLCWLQSSQRVPEFKPAHARNAVRAVAYARRRDSLREFVESLPEWDGTERIEHAFADGWGAADTPLTRAASRNFFVALMARAMQPGAQVDTVWSFEADQGKRKSQALRALGGEFHAEISAPIGSDNFMRELQGTWIAELSELDALRGREASTIKRLLSATKDRFVPKYANHAESYPRRSVCVATTNEATYWQDPTGARRLVPIVCNEIRVDIVKASRLQWLAEARHLYRSGATWWDFTDGIGAAQDARQQVDPWEQPIVDYLDNNPAKSHVLVEALLSDPLEVPTERQTTREAKRVAAILARMGWVRPDNAIRFEGRRARWWTHPERQ